MGRDAGSQNNQPISYNGYEIIDQERETYRQVEDDCNIGSRAFNASAADRRIEEKQLTDPNSHGNTRTGGSTGSVLNKLGSLKRG